MNQLNNQVLHFTFLYRSSIRYNLGVLGCLDMTIGSARGGEGWETPIYTLSNTGASSFTTACYTYKLLNRLASRYLHELTRVLLSSLLNISHAQC